MRDSLRDPRSPALRQGWRWRGRDRPSGPRPQPAAIAVAKQQSTRSFQLRAALALAKLYQSTSRPADAHAVLAPALGGFAPTSELPEIDEALELMAAIKASTQL